MNKIKFNKKIIFLVCSFIFIVILVATIFITNKLHVNNLKFDKWEYKKNEENELYTGTIISNETKPFITVVTYNEDCNLIDIPLEFVYMNSGKGTLYSNSDSIPGHPSDYYKILGYIKGNKIADSNFLKLECDDVDYHDFTQTSKTIYSGIINIDMKKENNGILFVEISNDINDYTKLDMITITNGIGRHYYSQDLPLKSRGVNINIIPKLFCESKQIESEDYNIISQTETDKTVKNDLTEYDCNIDIQFDEIKYGVMFYELKLVNMDNIIQRNTGMAYLKNGKFKSYILLQSEKEKWKDIQNNTLEFNPLRYIKIIPYNN